MSSTVFFCRACLTRSNRVHQVSNRELQTLFLELTALFPNGTPNTPITLCYICLALLQKCWKFKLQSREANKQLEKGVYNGDQWAPDVRLDDKIKYTLSVSKTKHETVDCKSVKYEYTEVYVKEECVDSVHHIPDNSYAAEHSTTEIPASIQSNLVKEERKDENIANKPESMKLEIKTTLKPLPKSPQKGYYCDSCGKKFKHYTNLRNHMNKHNQVKLLSCMKCSQKFFSQIDLLQHVHCDGKKDLNICDTCGKAYVSKYSLQVHISQKHLQSTGLKVYKCETCSKNFNHRGTLRLHMRTHTGDKPYSCDRCPKSFSQKGTLRRHYRMHTGEKPYACHECTKTFNQESSLKRHIKMHNGEKPYACSKCDKAYYESSHLTRHMRTHTGEKPYACDRCFQTFSQSSNLHAHMKKHTGRKASNFSCHECNMAFDHRSIYNRHLLKHTQEKPYPCNQCDKKYADKRTLQRHILGHSQNNTNLCTV